MIKHFKMYPTISNWHVVLFNGRSKSDHWIELGCPLADRTFWSLQLINKHKAIEFPSKQSMIETWTRRLRNVR